VENNIKQIAERIRTLREIDGESIESAAKALGVKKEEYEGYESGKSDIPVSFLYEIAGRYKVELTALLTGGEPHMNTFSIVRKGSAPKVERSKEYSYQDLAYNFKHKKMEIFEVTAGPKPGDVAGHYNAHPGQEFNYCLEGEIKIFIGKNEMILKTGDSIYFDSGIPHAMVSLNNKPAKFLAVIL